MPLHDHFHALLKVIRNWESFHGMLPESSFAESQVATWASPATTLVMSAVFPDVIEVHGKRTFPMKTHVRG